MAVNDLVGKASATLVTGVVGVVAVEAAKKWAIPLWGRKTAVTAAALGLRSVRAAEVGAENVRLYGADLLAEARAQVGETAPPPGAATEHGHEH